MSTFANDHEIWFITGSQHLYGDETLRQVAAHSQEIAAALDASPEIRAKVVFKPVLTGSDGILKLCLEANSSPKCIGLIAWMHTFSPAKMWIAGLRTLSKPICHLHTQYNRDIPWATMDMDFMNLNQSAHGDREFGFMMSRLRMERKVVVGHWQAPQTIASLSAWTSAAKGWHEMRNLKLVRFGDNMRQVSVTCGDKVEAQIRFGMEVNTHGIGDLAAVIARIGDAETDALCTEYAESYTMMPSLLKGGEKHESLRTAARIELGLRAFLTEGGFHAYTDTFEDLYGLDQLPGIASQRLMADGYGFGAEGDWKQAAMTRVLKAMVHGDDKGTSFMEDYTYNLGPDGMYDLGAHMLEICPSIAAGKPSCEIRPLGIGGKADPIRLVFDGKEGDALNAALVDMGNRFRMVVNTVKAVKPLKDLPKLPVARVLWEPMPNLATGAAAWILAGGGHHTAFSYSVTTEMLEDFAGMSGVEMILIDEDSKLRDIKNELRWNDAAYGLKGL